MVFFKVIVVKKSWIKGFVFVFIRLEEGFVENLGELYLKFLELRKIVLRILGSDESL